MQRRDLVKKDEPKPVRSTTLVGASQSLLYATGTRASDSNPMRSGGRQDPTQAVASSNHVCIRSVSAIL